LMAETVKPRSFSSLTRKVSFTTRLLLLIMLCHSIHA
jgi:hypothetical protein